MRTHEEQGGLKSPVSVDQFLSFGTSTPIADERKEREEYVL
jgi:hypothetical protein